MPSLKRNIIFNYAGQFYVGFIGIAILPLYLKYLGPEEYGLIGVFTLIQAWMQILDLGLSPTLSKEIASNDNKNPLNKIRTLIRSLEIIFIGIAITAGTAIICASEWISSSWLKLHEVPIETASFCITLMGFIIAIRWPVSLYKSGINAYEHQVAQNIITIGIVTLRFPLTLALVMLGEINIVGYFVAQLLISILELFIFRFKLYQLLPKHLNKTPIFSTTEIKRVSPFAMSVAYTGFLWVLATQIDKLILSSTLTLKDYGYFTLIASICSAIVVISAPISTAILPRLISNLSQGKHEDMLNLYRSSSRLVSCILAPVVIVVAMYPFELVQAWTGNQEAALWTKSILPLFIIGNGLIALTSFPSYIQYAYGNLRINIVFNTVTTILFIPTMYYTATNYGPLGAGYAWVVFRAASLIILSQLVHKKFANTITTKWLFRDIITPIITVAILSFIWIKASNGYLPKGSIYTFLSLGLLIASLSTLTIILNFPTQVMNRVKKVVLQTTKHTLG